MSITILRPEVQTVSIIPNPVNFNSPVIIRVVVEDISIILEPEFVFSGEIYSGEDFI